MAKWWEVLETLMGGGSHAGKRTNTLRWLFILAGIGMVLLILNSFLTVKEIPVEQPSSITSNSIANQTENQPVFQNHPGRNTIFIELETTYENNLKEILQKIVGVGFVEVLVTVESTEEMMVDRNTTESNQTTDEKDKDGATRKIKQTTRSGEIVMNSSSGDKNPVVRKTIKPTIRGVLIVAEGAEQATIKKLILDAVHRGLGVPPHRISIVPGKR